MHMPFTYYFFLTTAFFLKEASASISKSLPSYRVSIHRMPKQTNRKVINKNTEFLARCLPRGWRSLVKVGSGEEAVRATLQTLSGNISTLAEQFQFLRHHVQNCCNTDPPKSEYIR